MRVVVLSGTVWAEEPEDTSALDTPVPTGAVGSGPMS